MTVNGNYKLQIPHDDLQAAATPYIGAVLHLHLLLSCCQPVLWRYIKILGVTCLSVSTVEYVLVVRKYVPTVLSMSSCLLVSSVTGLYSSSVMGVEKSRLAISSPDEFLVISPKAGDTDRVTNQP